LEKLVLLVSDGVVHPSLLVRFWLRRALIAMPGYRFRRVASLEVLPERPLAPVGAVVLYVHHDTISLPALEQLEEFVGGGGGLLAIHSASASFSQEERWFELLGGRFVEHGPIEQFEVRPSELQGSTFGEIPPFSVRDELYRHEYDLDNRVHFYTEVGGEQEPVVWTRSLGSGRVCYCALGHTVGSMRHPQMVQILRRGLAWVYGDPPAEETPV
jgi:type 1 glutamine amidotransferase